MKIIKKLAKYLVLGFIVGLLLAIYFDCYAGVVSKPYTFTDGTVASASQVNANFDTLYTLVNGNIDNANISGSAGIVFSKLDSATVAGVSATQTLTNKTLTSPVLTTPQINDTSADHQYVFAVNELTVDRTVTLPLLTGNDTFVFNDFAATLTNKTLTSPAISSPTISGTPTASGATWTSLGTVTTAIVNDGAFYGQPLVWSKTFIVPEELQAESDAIPIMPIETSWAPYGIKITKCGIKTSASSTYSVVFEDWTSPTSGSSVDISTVATSSSTEAESGTLTTTVPAGDIVFIDLPTTTGLSWLEVWFIYEIKSS